jgi:endonuclease/exonuclease/phosphatase family metal-dependent hydrolase
MYRQLSTVGLMATALLLVCDVAHGVSSLRIMTFNVWTAEGTASGRDKLREIIETSQADIIGLQEMTDSAGRSIAASLGLNYHQQSSGDIQVLSRYPIIGAAPGGLGVQIELEPGQNIWFFNSHLSAYPYQPYDLRDGLLPMNENGVIAASNSARGAEVTSYLSSMSGAIASQMPAFFVGDFNEPSHLDWTSEAAAATPRSFDFKVQYPASKRIVDAGMIDSLRAVRPDEVNDTAYTWTPGYPPPVLDFNEVHDRIDIIYHSGMGVVATDAFTIGPLDGNSNTDLGIAGYNADHRAVVADYTLRLPADFDLDGEIGIGDWHVLRNNQFTDLTSLDSQQAWQRGDLNGDFRNDHADYFIFKSAFESVHGLGALATALAVPEPSSAAIACLAIASIYSRRCRPSSVGGSRDGVRKTKPHIPEL